MPTARRDSCLSMCRGRGHEGPALSYSGANRRFTAAIWLAAALTIAYPGPGAIGATVTGVVTKGGSPVPGILVRAQRAPRPEPVRAGMPTSTSDSGGAFSLALPDGTWYLMAGQGESAMPAPGGLFAFYGGNPVTVRGNQRIELGFNLVKVPNDGAVTSGSATGVEGRIVYQGKPLGKLYLYVYKNPGDGFRGMGHTVVPVGKDGTFRTGLPPGEYYLVARQRQAGGMLGALRKGDRVGYYHGNPVVVPGGGIRRIELEVTDVVEEPAAVPGGGTAAGMSVEGTVRDQGGRGVAGIYLLLYRDSGATGKPAHLSTATGGDGRFNIPVDAPGTFYMVARQNPGGAPQEGELTGRWSDRNGKLMPVVLDGPGRKVQLTLVVTPHRQFR